MFSPSSLRNLASGKQRGLIASLFQAAAGLLEVPVAWYVRGKNRKYDQGRAHIYRVAAPVISVGNLTTGGTGKTPMVRWIAQCIEQQGGRAVLISRGYGRSSQGGHGNDEARELAAVLPTTPHFQNPDRVAAAQLAIKEHAGSVLVLDDAFQHRRLHRDLDIVLLDALMPFGFDHLLPRGFLREPLEGLRRAHAVVLTRANQVDEATRLGLRSRVTQLAPSALWAEGIHAPLGLIDHLGQSQPLDWLRGRKVAAFCGIGSPGAFRNTLEGLGANVVAWREFADHYPYRAAQVTEIERWLAEANVEAAICTHKDLVKLPYLQLASRPLFALLVGMQLEVGEAELRAKISETIQHRSSTSLDAPTRAADRA